MHSIGFIGASGMMGHGMAKNLRARGHALALTVHRNRERVADLLAAGASVATSPSLLAGHSTSSSSVSPAHRRSRPRWPGATGCSPERAPVW